MLVDTPHAFRAALARERFAVVAPATPRAAFLVAPLGFRLSAETAADNRYMASDTEVSEGRALAEHAELSRALAETLPVIVFPGDRATPDAVFPNNVFATTPERLVVGRMRHPERRREAARRDIRDYFVRELGRELADLSGRDDVVAELTGPLVIDRGRRIGFCGLSERCDRAGAEAMHALFDLALTFVFALRPEEYHANVVMSVLASRALVLHAGSFVDPEVPRAVAELYSPNVLWLSDEEQRAFAGNCIALSERDLWMSSGAAAALRPASRAALESWGFAIRSAPLPEIEKAGGSLRCCVGEIY